MNRKHKPMNGKRIVDALNLREEVMDRCELCGGGRGKHLDQCPKWNTTEAARAALGGGAIEEAEAMVKFMEKRTKLYWGFAMLGAVLGGVVGFIAGALVYMAVSS